MARLLGFTLSILCMILVACTGEGNDTRQGDEPPETHAEDELAASLLLAIDDFPTGWAEDTSEDEEDSQLEKCDPGPAPGRTGLAETGDFSMGGSEEIAQSLAVFGSPSEAEAALDRVEPHGNCVVDEINAGKLDDSEAEFTDASFSRASFPSFGDQSRAYRLEAHVKAKGETALGSEGTLYIDYVTVAKGRFAFQIQAADVFSSFDSALLESLTATAAERIPDEGETVTAQPETPSEATPSPIPTSVPTPTPAPVGESPEDTVPLGEPGSVVEKLQAKVISVNLDAWPVVQAENMFNEPPEPGKRMVLITLEVTNVGSDSLEVGFEPTYGLVGDKAVVYDTFGPSCGVIPNELGGELFPGGAKQGNVCFQADTDDTNLILFVEMFTEDFDQERLFLALQ